MVGIFEATAVSAEVPGAADVPRLPWVYRGRASAVASPVLLRAVRALVPARLGTGQIRRASPGFVLEHTGQEVGGVAPVGHPEKIRTLLDESLKVHDLLWAGAGDHHSMFSITYEELHRITEAREMPVR